MQFIMSEKWSGMSSLFEPSKPEWKACKQIKILFKLNFVVFKRGSHKNKINELHYSDSSEVRISKRSFHFGFVPSIISNIIGKDKISMLGILTEKVRWTSTYNKYRDYSLLLFKIKESSCDTDGYRQEAKYRCQFLWSNVVTCWKQKSQQIQEEFPQHFS